MDAIKAERRRRIQDKTVRISCVIPVFNEEANIEPFLRTLHKALETYTQQFEIIVVDDGSHDATVPRILALIPEIPVRLLGFSRNFGKEIALTAGLEHATGELAILMDGDFQHPIALIHDFVQHWGDGYDMVYGVRRNRDTESRLKRGLAHVFYRLMALITRIDIPENAGDFRLLDRRVVDALNAIPERTRFMKGLYAWVGFRKLAVPFDVQERQAGRSGWGFMRLAELAVTGITSFSAVPLRVWGVAGFIISIISLIYAIYIVTVTLLYGTDLPGFPSIMVAVMFFGGIQLLSIGILGEYIARIFTEVKRRPKYVLQTRAGFDVE